MVKIVQINILSRVTTSWTYSNIIFAKYKEQYITQYTVYNICILFVSLFVYINHGGRIIGRVEPLPKLPGALPAVGLVAGYLLLHSYRPPLQVLVRRQVDKVAGLQRRHCRHKVNVGQAHGGADDVAAAGHLVGPHQRLLQQVQLLRGDGRRLAEAHGYHTVSQSPRIGDR